MNKKYIIFLSLLFIVFNVVLALLSQIQKIENYLQMAFLYSINVLLFLLSFFIAYQHKQAIEAKTNFQFLTKNFFVTVVRMATILVAVLMYYFFMRKTINITSVLLTMLFYFIYNYLELFFLLKGIKKKIEN